MIVQLPGSKSLTQRALVLAALADGTSELLDPLHCDDSLHLRRALRRLGVAVDDHGPVWRVHGGTLRPPDGTLHCGNAGTTLRFLAAFAALLDGPLTLDGDPRMRERPVGDLADALANLGVQTRWEGTPGFPPLTLCRRGPAAAAVRVDGSRSSQFASALLMIAPRLPGGLALAQDGVPVSRPYLAMTIGLLRRFGARVDVLDQGRLWRVAPGPLRPTRFEVEPDWSAAAFVRVAARLAGVVVRCPGLRSDSFQGDAVIEELLERLDDERPQTLDLADCPDLVAPLAAAAVFAAAPVELRGVAHARVKESDRPAVLADGLRRIGVEVQERPDGLRIVPGAAPDAAARIDPRGDHRMAMAFGVLSLRLPGIAVDDPGCVSKSYPAFWADLERLRAAARIPAAVSVPPPPLPPPGAGPLFLVGPRGAGKTEVGRRLAARLGLPFVDLDREVEYRGGRPIADYFAAGEEPIFRRLERTVTLEWAAAGDRVVVACGGGCVLDPEVRAALRRSGAAVWLDAPPAVRAARIAGSGRPPLTAHRAGEREEAEVAAAREPWYRECTAARVETGAAGPDEVAEHVERLWRSVAADHLR